MFDNIGEKIKSWAFSICVVGIIFSVVEGVLMIIDKEIALGVLTALVGALASWIGSFVLYGFGQLVENSDIIASSVSASRENIKPNKDTFLHRKSEKTTKKQEVNDDEKFTEGVCPSCGEALSFPDGMLQETTELTCPFCDTKIEYKG
ncbi:MAG: hypothetical protein IKJ55_08030 [Clostridia bacterium]|nr:hypothetical protein [Clostridia bacterium]